MEGTGEMEETEETGETNARGGKTEAAVTQDATMTATIHQGIKIDTNVNRTLTNAAMTIAH